MIAPKPKPAGNSAVNVEALINRGGSDSQGGKANGAAANAIEQVKLRIPAAMLRQVDAAVATRRLKTPRHSWILEAIDEKLQREAAKRHAR